MNVKFKNDLTNIAEGKSQPVSKFELLQNYPNPFNPSTLIPYSIPKPGKVRLSIYDSLGKNIRNLVDEFQNPGNYTVRFDAKDLASGIYFYELKLGQFSEARKMIVMH
jgi:hypothetical protein